MEKNENKKFRGIRTGALALVSLLLSLMLWVYITDTYGKETTQDYPYVQVRFEGETNLRDSRELIVTDASRTSVTVRLTGNRRTLANLESSDLSAVIDVSNITRTGQFYYLPTINFPTRTDKSSITQSLTVPSSISFYVDKLDRKTLTVNGTFSGSVAEGYVAQPLEFEPSTVIVYGPKNVLDQVDDYAYVTVNLTDVDKTRSFSSTYTLRDAEGNPFTSDELTFDTETVQVTLPINSVKTVRLVANLVYANGVTESNVKMDLKPNQITLVGDSGTLEGVNSITVARIDLAGVDETLTASYPIVIPNNTEIIGGATETTLNLEITGLYKQVFQIDKSNITCINVSSGYVADIGNDFLDVVIRGPEEAVKALSPENIYAVADLAEYDAGTGSFTVRVRIRVDGTTEVGDVGEYRVVVNLREASEEPNPVEPIATPAPTPVPAEGNVAEDD